MGANTTLQVSRDAAFLAVAKKTMPHLSNEALEKALNDLLAGSLYNVWVTHDGEDDDELMRAIGP